MCIRDRDYTLCATILFCCSTCFKVTTTVFAFGFLFYVLGKLFAKHSFLRAALYTVLHALVALSTLAIIFAPWLSDVETLKKVWQGIFPLERKLIGNQRISNVWYVVSFVYDIEEGFTISQTALLSFVVTISLTVYCTIGLLWNQRKAYFLLCLAGSSLSFYLFGFHMHEKVILLPLLIISLLLPLFQKSYPNYILSGTFTTFVLARYSWKMYAAYYFLLLLSDCLNCAFDRPGYLFPAHHAHTHSKSGARIEGSSKRVHGVLQAVAVVAQAVEAALLAVDKQDYGFYILLNVSFCINVLLWIHIELRKRDFSGAVAKVPEKSE
eukprot:TRINITY_DN3635_c0_g2_i3.p1 TRINITY_DN3635_c0_g2~~TRINITY_DN3635_c0_g2_i3.p1  ORF type:complete len:324 (-),score=56.69 TRINITY_DN3635_c0_g2_i3:65-1036(-)